MLYQRWLPPPSASACVQPTFAPASVHVRLHIQNPNRATPGELPTPTAKSPASKGLLPPCCAVLQRRCTPAAGKSGPGIFAHSHSRPTHPQRPQRPQRPGIVAQRRPVVRSPGPTWNHPALSAVSSTYNRGSSPDNSISLVIRYNTALLVTCPIHLDPPLNPKIRQSRLTLFLPTPSP